MDNTNQHHTTRKGSTYGRIAAESRIQPPTLPPAKLPPKLPDCPVCRGVGYSLVTHEICASCDGDGFVESRHGQATPAEGSHD